MDVMGVDFRNMVLDQEFTLSTLLDEAICYAVYDARGNGSGGCVPTLTGDHENRITDYTTIAVIKNESICYEIPTDENNIFCISTQQGGAAIYRDQSPTITAAAGTSGNNQPWLCIGNGQLHQMSMLTVTNTLDCMHDQQILIGVTSLNNGRKYVLRRLTPLECARLQGFPDWWVDGAEGSDSAIYKMWGNGIALPCAADVIGRIVKEAEKNG